MTTNEVIIFTDGSANQTVKDKYGRKRGGLGIFFSNDDNRNVSKKYNKKSVTNQRMELLACIIGIRMVDYTTKKPWNLTIFSDSMYSINCATKWGNKWKKNDWKKGDDAEICNLDLVKKLHRLTTKYNVNYIHTRSHKKEPPKKPKWKWDIWYGNDMADQLASYKSK
jgi:ribonuclease HI